MTTMIQKLTEDELTELILIYREGGMTHDDFKKRTKLNDQAIYHEFMKRGFEGIIRQHDDDIEKEAELFVKVFGRFVKKGYTKQDFLDEVEARRKQKH